MARVAGLDVASIVAMSLQIADRHGLDRLTMRRLSAALDVTPMAIYHHVGGKEQLLDLVVDESLRELAPVDAAGDPESELIEVFLGLHRLLVDHPALAQVMAGRPLEGPMATAVGQDVLAVMARAGVSDADAVQLLISLFSFALGSGLYRVSRLEAESRRQDGRFAEAGAYEAPEVHRLRDELTNASLDDRHVREGVRRLVNSYLH